MPEIGSPEHPIKVLFVPSVDANVIVAGGDIMAQALNEATGLTFEVSVPTSYAATIEEMCASPTDTMAFIPAFGYVLANDLCGVDVAFRAVRRGWGVYWTMFVVARDSDIQTLADLEGKKWAYPDAGSTSGYLVPQVVLKEEGVTPISRPLSTAPGLLPKAPRNGIAVWSLRYLRTSAPAPSTMIRASCCAKGTVSWMLARTYVRSSRM
jgi:phosphate/phosphite/phosphonate ABC transporter binding protein